MPFYQATTQHSTFWLKNTKKVVHALAWRKIGDFHYAEEITQDAFLRAYQKLSTLRRSEPVSLGGYMLLRIELLSELAAQT